MELFLAHEVWQECRVDRRACNQTAGTNAALFTQIPMRSILVSGAIVARTRRRSSGSEKPR